LELKRRAGPLAGPLAAAADWRQVREGIEVRLGRCPREQGETGCRLFA
jgi:hypothetical protein